MAGVLLAFTAPTSSSAETIACPMAGKIYKFRFNEKLRGKIRFNAECSFGLIELPMRPEYFFLERNPNGRGWNANFTVNNRPTRNGKDTGSLKINETGTRLTFLDAKTRLYPVRDTQ
ncbi:hypothetical protein [Pseudophaeobacter sp.]|uniref:hypothetical protein n=1 Tax=Pseudophaeobacter sp. TaxID=1971739 RepID=UPI003298E5A6